MTETETQMSQVEQPYKDLLDYCILHDGFKTVFVFALGLSDVKILNFWMKCHSYKIKTILQGFDY